MIGLDTNILLRHLVQDDPVQSPRASELIERRLTPEAPGFISAVVLAELAWVLGRTYRLSSARLAEVLEWVLRTETFVVEHEQEAWSAVVAVVRRQGSFADAYLGAIARSAGCDHTVTFDRKALRLPDFHPL